MYQRLLTIIENLGTPKVLLAGDFMLDHYLMGNIDRISPEAPVAVLNVSDRQEQPGGAGSVAVDLATLDVEVRCLGIVGDDRNGRVLKDMLCAYPTVTADYLVIDENRPTTSKQRIVGLAQHRHRQQLMRIDEEDTRSISPEIQDKLFAYYLEGLKWCDVVCLEDYNKGVLHKEFCTRLIEAATQAGKKTIVDPGSISDYSRYRGAWMVKPNRRELSIASGVKLDGDMEIYRQAAGKLTREYNIANIVATLDKSGAYLYQAQTDSGELVPTRARSVYDVTGAGDMVLAMLGTLVGAQYKIEPPSMTEIIKLANIAGGLEVEKFGCVGISRAEIMTEICRDQRLSTGKICSLDDLLNQLRWRNGKKVVFTNGCYDILHPGHIELLKFASRQGDLLVVGVNSDASVSRLKGPKRPILNQHERTALIAALESVDYVVVFDQDTPQELIEKICPDVLIKGTDWQGKVVGQDWVEAHGGQCVLMPLIEGLSTTGIVERILERYK
ncbi:MAG: bifunctional heptose 7-phosphate kinase/heptose 1-phosphate adenyltransferase [Sedimentisphaerales bacterium]|nr:bifunctional heptose 7-phosphate kinase/heptose 1-phosphate adenyltransferase [Sedimentisphaerales bacterium]